MPRYMTSEGLGRVAAPNVRQLTCQARLCGIGLPLNGLKSHYSVLGCFNQYWAASSNCLRRIEARSSA
eukprot:1562132-Alexandrium_andersonii.AAC.1